MISREDFVFSIGFDGNTAIVNTALKRKYGKLTTRELAEKGLFKAALCSAIFAGIPREVDTVLEVFNRSVDTPAGSADELKRIFGVAEIPRGATKVMHL